MELRDYLRILRGHWIVIVALTALGVLVAFAWSSLQPRVYTATASGYVTSSSSSAADGAGGALIGDQLASAKVTSYVDIGSWRSVAQYAIDSLGLSASPEQVVTRVSVSNPVNTVIIHVSADAGTPEEARDLAEAWIRGMVQAIDEVEGNGTEGSAPVTLIPGDSARLPGAPSSPNTRLNLLLGGLVGLAGSIGYAVVRHTLDRRVRHPKDIERETGTAVVGTLPLERKLVQARSVVAFDSNAANNNAGLAESLRELRTNLQFMNVDSPPRVIVVTSPVPGDGKSTTAANLAVSLAAAGQRVVLIDADLRRPVVHSVFGLPDEVGLTDVLAGRVRLADVSYTADRSGMLTVLPAGRIPPNPSEVLGSQRMRELLASLRQDHLVIVDAPPVIPVTDAAVLSTAADGVLVIVSAGKTTFDMLQKSIDNIARANGDVLGVVLNKVPRKGAESGYYGYQYKGEYYASDAKGSTVSANDPFTEPPQPREHSTDTARRPAPVEPLARHSAAQSSVGGFPSRRSQRHTRPTQ